MNDLPISLLIFSGFVSLLVGLLCGVPLARAILRGRSEDDVRAWRVAHSSLVMGGVMLLAIAAVLPRLALSSSWRLAIALLLSMSIYTFGYALIVGAWKRYRGLRREHPVGANAVYYANVAGVWTSLVAVVALAIGAAGALLRTLLT